MATQLVPDAGFQYRRSPTANAAFEEWLKANPQARPAHSHPWDVSRSDIYVNDTWGPIFAEMRTLVAKTVGIRDVLLAALLPLKSKIAFAFVYGSVARSRERQKSDVDLMIVGGVHFADVVDRIANAQTTLNREINPTVYTASEFRGKLRGNFLKTVLGESKLFLIGDEDVLRKLGQ